MTKYPVIAAVKNKEEFQQALETPVETIFHLTPNILSLKKEIDLAHACGKKLLMHIDFAEGIGKDRCGVLFSKKLGVDGIISTRVNMIKIARELGLFTVQRFFIVDTRSVDTTVESLKSSKADMIEVMPGVVPKVIKTLKERISVPIIAGGLIQSAAEVRSALDGGAAAVSTGSQALWNRNEEN